MIVLYLCLGFGVVKEAKDFSRLTIFKIRLLVFFLIVSICLPIITELYLLERRLQNEELLIALVDLPYFIVIMIFAIWSAVSLQKTIKILSERNQKYKLAIFNFFKNVLHVAYFFVVLLTLAMIVFSLNVDMSKYYMVEVYYTFIWPVGFWIVQVIVMMRLAPN
jgi:hypothetical protein